MFSLNNIQDIIRCHLCDTSAPFCIVKRVISTFVQGVLLTISWMIQKKVVRIKQRKLSLLYRKLTTHAKNQCEMHEQCELFCKQCDIPICSSCLSSSQY